MEHSLELSPIAPSPQAMAGGMHVGNRMSRGVAYVHGNALLYNNKPFSLSNVKWQRTQHVTQSSPTHPMSSDEYVRRHVIDAQLVGKGKAGCAYTLPLNKDNRNALNSLFDAHLTNVLINPRRFHQGEKMILLKVVKYKKSDRYPYETFVETMKREAEAQMHLCRHPPVTIGKTCRLRVKASDYVPCLYRFGIDMDRGLALFCMQYIQGTPLQYLKKITASIYIQTQKLFATLWASSVEHGDAHFHNLIVTPQGRLYILDFEFSLRIEKSARDKLINILNVPRSYSFIDAIAQAYLSKHANAIQWQRTSGRLSFYNPAYKTLRVLWSKMSNSERTKVKKYYGDKSMVCAWS